MNFYRCNPNQGSGSSSSAESYTITINGTPLRGVLRDTLPNNFNQNIAIGDQVSSCYFMFVNQSAFNSNVVLSNNIVNFGHMFENSAFNQRLKIPYPYNPNKARHFVYMFKNCPMSNDIWMDLSRNDNTYYMLNGRRDNLRINIYGSLMFHDYEFRNYLISSTPLTYELINNNCMYNAAQNIYMYRNNPQW